MSSLCTNGAGPMVSGEGGCSLHSWGAQGNEMPLNSLNLGWGKDPCWSWWGTGGERDVGRTAGRGSQVRGDRAGGARADGKPMICNWFVNAAKEPRLEAAQMGQGWGPLWLETVWRGAPHRRGHPSCSAREGEAAGLGWGMEEGGWTPPQTSQFIGSLTESSLSEWVTHPLPRLVLKPVGSGAKTSGFNSGCWVSLGKSLALSEPQ